MFLGTFNATVCPRGSYRDVEGGGDVTDCNPCTPGMYCDGEGLTEATGLCAAGYYCPESEFTQTARPTGFECPTGHYCGNGTADPFPCDPGYYQPTLQSTDCDPCPEGYYCMYNTTVPIICPAYHFCPEMSGYPTLCLNGTYTEDHIEGLAAPENCELCPTGANNCYILHRVLLVTHFGQPF